MVLRFSESVETSFGAVRVFDAKGRRVDTGATTAALRLQRVAPGCAPGSPTARTPPPTGSSRRTRTRCRAGSRSPSGSPAAPPRPSVADLVDSGGAGHRRPRPRSGGARALGYAAIAVLVGGAVLPARGLAARLRAARVATTRWRRAAEAMSARVRRLVVIAAGAGARRGSAAGIVLQGATAVGHQLLGALDGQVLHDVLATRFGTRLDRPPRRVRCSSASPWRVPAATRRPARAVAAGPARAAYLVVAPRCPGTASATDQWLLVPSDIVHVAAMSAWVGGLAMLVFALPARDAGAGARRTARRAGAVRGAVLDGRAGGGGGAGRHRGRPVGGPAGRVRRPLRQRLRPCRPGQVRAAAGAARPGRVQPPAHPAAAAPNGPGPARRPGGPGVRLRRAIRTEVALLAAVLVVTAALVGYSPTAGARRSGPFSADQRPRPGAAGADRRPGPGRGQRDPPLPVRPPRAARSTTARRS